MKVLLTDSNDCIIFNELGQEEILHSNEFALFLMSLGKKKFFIVMNFGQCIQKFSIV